MEGFDAEPAFRLFWEPDEADLADLLRWRARHLPMGRGLRIVTGMIGGAMLLGGALLAGHGELGARILAALWVLAGVYAMLWALLPGFAAAVEARRAARQARWGVRRNPDQSNEAAVFDVGVRLRSRSTEVRMRWYELTGLGETERSLLLPLVWPARQVCILPKRALDSPAEVARLRTYLQHHLDQARTDRGQFPRPG